MNEELQSALEEQATINEVLRHRSLELDHGNAIQEAILSALGVGVMLVDRDERVRLWNLESEDLWGLRSGEVVGTAITDLDFGLPIEDVRPALRRALGGAAGPVALEADATDRRGRHFRCHITVVPLPDDGPAASGAVVLSCRVEPSRV